MLEDPEEEAALPVLGAISAFLRWLEELIVLLSGPLLMVGLGIGLVALLSDGAVLVSSPWLLYVWAVSQTIGVDGQLVGAWYRVSVAVSRGRWGVAVAFAVLGLVLAYVGYVAALTFATQQAYHLTTAQALAKQGMDATSWLWQRAAVSVLLVCLSGYLRYRAPRQSMRSLEERKRAIREQMELAQLKREQRAQQAQGAIGLLRGTVAAVREPHDVGSLRANEKDGEADSASPLSSRSSQPQPQPQPALPMAWPRVQTTRSGDDRMRANHHQPREQ